MPSNSLSGETSPYLLQHAQNPVWWHAWNDAALGRARDENKPIFLSIGYSACHWCHVMAHESFENDDIAGIMNEHFVSIKVDREERPDIDDIYQKACQLATGQGGWPLSAFLTPDQKPFYVGTYFPVLDSHGRPGFGSILRRLAQAWSESPDDIARSAEKFLVSLRAEPDGRAARLEKTILDEAALGLLQMGDPTHGGFGRAPKFPTAANISFLFRYGAHSGISKFEKFALMTLRRMARGGMFDQLGGGFHRYSTDARWLVPHFEKMLYDNALVPVNYAEAYQITRDESYLDTMRGTLDFVLREMTSPRGGFYSAYDADSGGSEGSYYVWSKREIRDVLGDDADVFCMFYDVTDGGNWEGGNILYNSASLSSVAFQHGITQDEARGILGSCSARLLERRSARPAPGLDEKILTSWNALMITALARGHRVSGDGRYLDAAVRCVDFVESEMSGRGGLLHAYKDGRARIGGYLEDHAYYANALLDVFEDLPDARYLERAAALGRHLVEHFWDPLAGDFFMTSDEHEHLIVRPKSSHDLSLPSGSSAAAHLMLRLHHLTGAAEFSDIALRVLESHALAAAENPFAFGYLLNTIHLCLQKPLEVTVIGAQGDISDELRRMFLPEAFLVTVRNRGQLEALSSYAYFAGKRFEDKTAVYVCRDGSCSLPLRDMPGIRRALGR